MENKDNNEKTTNVLSNDEALKIVKEKVESANNFFGGFESLHSIIFPKGRLKPHMIVCLTQHYRTEALFKPTSLPWNIHKILIIR